MKPSVIQIPAAAVAVLAAAALGAASASAQLPTGSAFSIAPGAATNSASITVADPGNHVWVLQSSPDLSAWTNVETWQVHNGNFHRSINYTPVAGLRAYYRTFYDSTSATIPNTTANALLLPATLANYAKPTLPPSFLVQPILGQDNTPAHNPVTDAAATLGRALFYDKRLSLNQTVSCSSCHQQAHAFADPRRVSIGFNGTAGTRHAMGLNNGRWYLRRAFFWDERAATLEDQVLQPIQNPIEMGMNLPDLLTRLSAEPYYATLFTSAFGDSTVTSDRVSKALAQFVRSIISTQSKYDVGVANNFSNFTAQENQGRQIFLNPAQGNCAACHGTDNFVPGAAIFNNGLENPYIDKGVGGISGRTQDEGLFKVPSLRNIALAGPYMHDGRFATLDQVVEFYNSGVVNHPNLSPQLRGPGGQPRRLNLTTDQKAALVAFLNTLTDTSITTDTKLSDPFNYGD